MIKAIAFDPGKTTGFATGEIDGGPMLIQTAQAVMTHLDIMNFLNNFKPDYVICESFEFRQKARTGLELISREFIGIVELYTQMNPDTTLVMQNPGVVVDQHFTPEKLKKYGLYRKPILGNSQVHANEACMHLCYWFRFGSGAQYGTEFQLKST